MDVIVNRSELDLSLVRQCVHSRLRRIEVMYPLSSSIADHAVGANLVLMLAGVAVTVHGVFFFFIIFGHRSNSLSSIRCRGLPCLLVFILTI